MSTVRVMFVGHGPSNLPADRVVNVFHFVGPNDYATDVVRCQNLVDAFFTHAQANFAVGGYLSPWVQRAAELRAYDMDIPKDTRVPSIVPVLLPGPFGDGLPEEVATVLTLHGYVPPAISRRRSGRLYFGPLCTNAGSLGSATQPTRPSPTFLADIVTAAKTLRDVAAGWPVWCIRSTRPAENYVPIQGGYCDNAFDTQRRRGPDPSVKYPWLADAVDPGIL